jgi:hypothetical protein
MKLMAGLVVAAALVYVPPVAAQISSPAPGVLGSDDAMASSDSHSAGGARDVFPSATAPGASSDDAASATPAPSHELPEAPSAVKTSEYAAAPATEAHQRQLPPPAATGALTYGEQRAVDWKFGLITTALFSSSVANAELTARCLQVGTCSYIPSALRSRAALYGIGLPTDVVVSFVSLRLKSKGMRYWWASDVAITAANLYVGAHALHRIRQH